MPIYRGSFIPFDAAKIADLLLRGEDVQPDTTASQSSVETQRAMLDLELSKRMPQIGYGSPAITRLRFRGLWRK